MSVESKYKVNGFLSFSWKPALSMLISGSFKLPNDSVVRKSNYEKTVSCLSQRLKHMEKLSEYNISRHTLTDMLVVNYCVLQLTCISRSEWVSFVIKLQSKQHHPIKKAQTCRQASATILPHHEARRRTPNENWTWINDAHVATKLEIIFFRLQPHQFMKRIQKKRDLTQM